MTEQAAQDRAGCSAASGQIPDALHIDLPQADPEEICFIINKCLIQITPHWELMADGSVTCAMVTALANSCMDIIQTFAEAILDVVMPQVYRHMRTYGTFSPTIVDLTEDRIYTYLGDSFEQALDNCLKIKVQNFESTKVFSQLLLRHISKTVNSVLALSTRTPILESRLPVVFVSGCVTSISNLKDMVCQIATILTRALEAQQPAQEMKLKTPIFCLQSRRDLKKLVKTYIIRMVRVLKSRAQMPHCEMSSSNHRDVCLRVGTITRIITVEDSESHEQQSVMSSYSGLDDLPGVVPDSNDTESNSESYPFSSVTVICATEDHSHCLAPNEMESIENIADDLVETFLKEVLKGAGQTDSSGLEVVDNIKLREVTDRIFNVVMNGHDYQIPLVPAGTRMCDSVTYRKLRRGDVTDPGIIAHALYMRTEEVISRCAMQVLLWSVLRRGEFDYPSSYSLDEFSDDLDFLVGPRQEAGDHMDEEYESTPTPHSSSALSQDSNATHNVIPEPRELTQPQLVSGIVHTCLLSLMVGEMLTVIGIRNLESIFEVVKKVIEQLRNVDPNVYNHFQASLMGHSYKDIYQTVINDLLLEFGSIQVMQEVLRSGDPSFVDAIMRELRKHLRFPTTPEPHGTAEKKTTCGFFKKLRLCCKKALQKAGKTTTVISLTSDQDKLQDHLSKEEPVKDQTEQHQCPLMKRIAASTRIMCSSSRKMFSSIARALGRPFITCFSPERQ